MKNTRVSGILRGIAKILEIKADNPFRIRAYERAAQNIEALTDSQIDELIRAGKLTQVPGIGADLEDKIKEIASTGKLKFYEGLKKTVPAGVLDLLDVPGIGPKTAALLHGRLKIKGVRGLQEAIRKGRLKGIPGIKEKTIENIQKGIAVFSRGRERMNLAQATQVADEFAFAFKKVPQVKYFSFAGSLRRQKETIRDIDILVISREPQKVMDAFTGFAAVKEVLAKGKTKASVRTKDDVQVDCRVLDEKSFGAALLYFTGSKNFNIKVRQLAVKKGLKVNEYGVFKGDKFIAGRNEQEIFRLLGMAYIEPELREDTGEIELAQKLKLPRLIELKDIKGDLHLHSSWSDGGNTIEEMGLACRQLGYSYCGLTDHSQSLKVAGGLSVSDLKMKKRQIDKLNKKIKGLRILYATEVDIDSEGRLDYRDEVLKEFDVVVAAVHTGFKQPKSRLTKRLVSACKNKYCHIIAHPTGRLFGSRDAYEVDFKEVFKAAKDTNTALEINAFPQRLDLNDLNCRSAKGSGVKLAINTDAHTAAQLGAMKFGLSVARRGWLSGQDVINTLPLDELLKTIRK